VHKYLNIQEIKVDRDYTFELINFITNINDTIDVTFAYTDHLDKSFHSRPIQHNRTSILYNAYIHSRLVEFYKSKQSTQRMIDLSRKESLFLQNVSSSKKFTNIIKNRDRNKFILQ